MKKSRKSRKTSAWFQRHVHDPHVKRAQREGKRSRAAYKLMQILDEYQHKVLQGQTIVDLGCAPGSWTMELVRMTGQTGKVIGIDVLPVEPIAGAQLIQADFTSEQGQQALQQALSGHSVDMVVSDMAPEMSGHKLVDQMRMIALNELTLHFSRQYLRKGGVLLLKSFMGEGYDQFRRELGMAFTQVKHVKPAASRRSSPEFFLLAKGFRG